ncbi:hypothetical protein [Bosea vaviloviae]|uniref:Uncharacterized protein n=1 Tax=Bosea vaviloviae TaxID=1526658 RepID=A0A1D7U2X6_9HYPH|nr:hypothetical protein [Bosea vaviloviae]AOO81728.1 hypothetical protein BHK69_15855 [Bosea vaviloviae]
MVQLSPTIGKFPIWCFFIGLVASGLQLIASYAYAVESRRMEADEQVQKLYEKTERSFTPAVAQGDLSARAASIRGELQHLKDQLREIDFGQPRGFRDGVRNAQEWLLWAAYGFFVIGLASVVWST